MKVSYYLDGEKMDPKDMAGKSGEVKIRFDYYNNSNETVKVKGKKLQYKDTVYNGYWNDSFFRCDRKTEHSSL